MSARFTDEVVLAILSSYRAAGACGCSLVETEHLLLGVLETDHNLAGRLCGSQSIVASIRSHTGTPKPAMPDGPLGPPPSPQVKRALVYAAQESERLGGWHISTAHVLLGLLREEDSRAAQILRDQGLEIHAARERIARANQLTTAQSSREILHQMMDEFPAFYWLLGCMQTDPVVHARVTAL